MSEGHIWKFAEAGKRLGTAASLLGLSVPAFRAPPRVEGTDRTIRWGPNDTVSVSVRIRRRPWAAVLADMIDGVVCANRLNPSDAARVRNECWQAVGDISGEAAPVSSPELPLPEAGAESRAA